MVVLLLKKIILVYYCISDNINIEFIKSEALKNKSVLFFDADKRYLKHFGSVKRIFYNHCEAEYLIIYTSDKIKFNSMLEINKDEISEILLPKTDKCFLNFFN